MQTKGGGIADKKLLKGGGIADKRGWYCRQKGVVLQTKGGGIADKRGWHCRQKAIKKRILYKEFNKINNLDLYKVGCYKK